MPKQLEVLDFWKVDLTTGTGLEQQLLGMWDNPLISSQIAA